MNNYPYYNQYYGQPMQIPRSQPIQPVQPVQPVEQQYPQYTQPQPIFKQQVGLQGKSVDSVEVVKAMDIPLDGTISYFPITDGSAIVTKQLQQDGSSKTIIYKPVEAEQANNLPKYVTTEELEEKLKDINNNELREEIKNIKKQMKSLLGNKREVEDYRKDR